MRKRKKHEGQRDIGEELLEDDEPTLEAEGVDDPGDELSRPRRRSGGRRRVLVVLGALVVVLVLLAAGIAFAGYEFSNRYSDRILPGAEIAGVSLEGMTSDEAIAAVAAKIGPQLDREITVAWKNRTWTVTPRELGAEANAEALVEEALARSAGASFADKLRMRLFQSPLDFEEDVSFTYPDKGVRRFVRGIAAALDKDPRDAAIDYSTGWVEIESERIGRRVQARKTRDAMAAALQNGDDRVELAVRETAPEKTTDDFEQVLLLRIGENKLYLYQDGEIAHTWTVATGQPEYRTPTGLYEVTLLRYMPTWVNPSPDGWGSDMPASIPPGPGNPLGVRAINWDAPAIRFHGTSATYSLGYNASHGCVRLSNSDVVELYDMIDVGVPIVSVEVGPLKPMYASAPDPTLVNPEGEVEEEAAPNSSSAEGKKKSSDDD